jgi:hypothetical protein
LAAQFRTANRGRQLIWRSLDLVEYATWLELRRSAVLRQERLNEDNGNTS